VISAIAKNSEKVGAVAELLDDGKVILRAYASPDGSRLRIVVPEFERLEQAAAEPSQHWIEVRRKA
jgi:hypothetical protein